MLLVAGLLLLGVDLGVMRAEALDLFRVPMPSMAPTLIPGDVFVADVRPRAPHAPVAGDVVLFEPHRAGLPLFAKRVAATAGHEVALRGGRLVVDGIDRSFGPGVAGRHVERLGGRRYTVEVGPGERHLDFGPLRVPPGHVFVLGDSRGRSVDSRSFGPVPLSAIRGRALRVLWSRDRAQQWRWQRVLASLTR